MGALSALRRLTVVIAIAIVFVFGLASTVYLSLRSPEVTVPDVVGKDRFEAEQVLGTAGLNFRVRSSRPNNEMKADTVLFQLPRAGEVVKTGQTVAMDISRSVKAGEASEAVVPEKSPEEKPANDETAANDNKTKRNKNTNANKNENDNSNANTANRNANVNRSTTNTNTNTGNVNADANRNSNRPALNINGNANRSVNQNGSEHPPTPPKASPSVRPRQAGTPEPPR
jgi:beta-lactam-binding protein with PASTA domain